MGRQSPAFSRTPEQSRDHLIGHLGGFLYEFPLYAQGARAGQLAAEAAGEILVHAAILAGEAEQDSPESAAGALGLLTSHLFLAGVSLLAEGNPRLFTSSAVDGEDAQQAGRWLHEIAGQVASDPTLPDEPPTVSAPDVSYDFLDCAAMGALNKSLEEAAAQQPATSEMRAQLALALVLLQAAIGYDLHMGEFDHALLDWAALAILASAEVEIPSGAGIPKPYQRMLAACLHSLGDSYALAKDFAYIYN